MKILKLSASNVLRLKAVEIEPDGTLQIVSGKNGAGKSSVLNAVWLALGGGAASREISKPVRDGEEWAEVTLDLGDLIVTRTWDATKGEKGTTKLTVRYPDGETPKQPQTLLDNLIGRLGFDPLQFTLQSPREQREELLRLLDLDFTAADRERERLYNIREDTGRRKRAYGELPKLAKNAPTVEKSASSILDRINQSIAANREIERKRDLVAEIDRHLDGIDRRVANLEAELVKLRDERAELVTRQADAKKSADSLPAGEDRDALDAELASVEEYNQTVRENRRILDETEAQNRLADEYAELGLRIRAIDDSKAAAIKAAKMPVPGLGFDDSGVTFNGMPLNQASSAEQLRVSMGMAVAMDPEIKVCLIRDGSLLDTDSMAAVRQIAEEYGVQAFVEVVGDSTDENAIVIVDGSVAE